MDKEILINTILDILVNYWYLFVLVWLVILYILIIHIPRKIYKEEEELYNEVKKMMHSINAVKKINRKEHVRIFTILLVVLLFFLLYYFCFDGPTFGFHFIMEKIGWYSLFYLFVVVVLFVITGENGNKTIGNYLIEDYNCVETLEGYTINLNKGYKGTIKFSEDKPFIKMVEIGRSIIWPTYYYYINVELEVDKYNEAVYDLYEVIPGIYIKEEQKRKKYCNEKVENILRESKELNLMLNIQYDEFKIHGFTEIGYRNKYIKYPYPTNAFESFFYMLEKSIEIANIIIDDENS